MSRTIQAYNLSFYRRNFQCGDYFSSSSFIKLPKISQNNPLKSLLESRRYCSRIWQKVIKICFRACVGLKPQNHMTLEHKLSREVDQPLQQNGVADNHLDKRKLSREVHQPLRQNGVADNHLENGMKKNGYVNGETKDLKRMNGDLTQVGEIKIKRPRARWSELMSKVFQKWSSLLKDFLSVWFVIVMTFTFVL